MAALWYGYEMTIALAAFLRPFVMVILFLVIGYPVRRACEKWFPEGKTKRFLLRRVGG